MLYPLATGKCEFFKITGEHKTTITNVVVTGYSTSIVNVKKEYYYTVIWHHNWLHTVSIWLNMLQRLLPQ